MRTVCLFFVSLFLKLLQEGQQERHRDAEGEAIGDGLAKTGLLKGYALGRAHG